MGVVAGVFDEAGTVGGGKDVAGDVARGFEWVQKARGGWVLPDRPFVAVRFQGLDGVYFKGEDDRLQGVVFADDKPLELVRDEAPGEAAQGLLLFKRTHSADQGASGAKVGKERGVTDGGEGQVTGWHGFVRLRKVYGMVQARYFSLLARVPLLP